MCNACARRVLIVLMSACRLVFGIATATNAVKLYDVRSFDKVRFACLVCATCWLAQHACNELIPQGPFSTFAVDGKNIEWTGMKFSPDGKFLLLTTTESRLVLLDAFEGTQVRRDWCFRWSALLISDWPGSCSQKQLLTTRVNKTGGHLEASFTPDSQYILAGTLLATVPVNLAGL